MLAEVSADLDVREDLGDQAALGRLITVSALAMTNARAPSSYDASQGSPVSRS